MCESLVEASAIQVKNFPSQEIGLENERNQTITREFPFFDCESPIKIENVTEFCANPKNAKIILKKP
jgi:hypothetical protein